MTQSANHYAFSGDGISGGIETTSLTGEPRGSVAVDGHEAELVITNDSLLGLRGDGVLQRTLDGPSRYVVIVVPSVNVDGDSAGFDGLAIIVTNQSNVGGLGVIRGPLSRYEVRPISGKAELIESLQG